MVTVASSELESVFGFFAVFSGAKTHAAAEKLPLPLGGGEGRGEGDSHLPKPVWTQWSSRRPLTLTLSTSEGDRESSHVVSVAFGSADSGEEPAIPHYHHLHSAASGSLPLL